MRLLLDTHILIWWLLGSRSLTDSIESSLSRADQVFVSAATVWEIGIKHALGRLDVSQPELADASAASGFESLPITADHARFAAQLPPHHADPFDRMLIAQAQLEELTLVTLDSKTSAYDVKILPA